MPTRISRGIRALTDGEMGAVLAAAVRLGEDLSDEIHLMLYTGAHVEEVYQPAKHHWTVDDTHLKYTRVKNGRWIILPLSLLPPRLSIIAERNRERNWKGYSVAYGMNRVKRVFRHAGIPAGSSLWLRHTFCRRLIAAGLTDTGVLKLCLGTDSLYTYADITGADLDRALEGKKL